MVILGMIVWSPKARRVKGEEEEEEESGIGGVAARLDLRSSSAAVVDAKCS